MKCLLEEVMRGEQSISVRFDEIEYAWKLIDACWRQKLPLFIVYEQEGSTGPSRRKTFSRKHGMRWRS